MDDSMFESLQTQHNFFLLPKTSRPVLGPTPPPFKWATGYFPGGVKKPGRDVDQTPPSRAEAKNEWS